MGCAVPGHLISGRTEGGSMSAVTSRVRRIHTSNDFGGIDLDVIDAGTPGSPVIVLCHGWPESKHSWRHQIDPLVNAGYRVLVPDQRGYGSSSAPRDVAAYRSDRLSADLIALLDDVDAEQATFVGHDWGALVVWDLARYHPDRVSGLINVSVPYTPWPLQPTELFRATYGDRFFYMLYFQLPNLAENELDADVARSLRTVIWGGSGETASPPTPTDQLPPMAGAGLLDTWGGATGVPDGLPAWLPADDFNEFVDQFTTSGFFGPISWYRNLDADWTLTKDLPAPPMPTAFIGGSKDMVIAHRMEYVESMTAMLPDYRGHIIIAGAGHWTQQEKPDEFNAALIQQLDALR
ncbi:MAG: pimeloyl-ACP methyl ester carboxylesterase [Ilumatobacter sp.]